MQSSSVGPIPILPPPASTFVSSGMVHDVPAELQPPSSAEPPWNGGATADEKKNGNCRFSCKDLKLGKAGTFLGKRVNGSLTQSGGGCGGASSKLVLKLVAAAEAAAAAIVEKQDTCSLATGLS